MKTWDSRLPDYPFSQEAVGSLASGVWPPDEAELELGLDAVDVIGGQILRVIRLILEIFVEEGGEYLGREGHGAEIQTGHMIPLDIGE